MSHIIWWLPRQAQALEEDTLAPQTEIDDASRSRAERLSHGVMEGISCGWNNGG